MNCTHCGTLLPPGALFCGECGRSVSSTAGRAPSQPSGLRPTPAGPSSAGKVLAPARWVEDPVTGQPLDDEPDEVVELDGEAGAGQTRCDQCGTVMAHDDIFCPECGFVSRSITRAFSTSDFTDSTQQLDFAADELFNDLIPAELPAHEAEPGPEPELEPAPADVDLAPEVEVEPARAPRLVSPPTRETPPAASPVVFSGIPRAPRTAAAPPSRPQPLVRADEIDEDIEATRIVNRMSGSRFVLQFSTGESFTVHGSGLIGRNPQPEPGEFFDHLVRVLDTGKSVSKTHLEFGQEHGAFWVKDRYSGNGTIIREPEISARRAEVDRRYRVVRGTRIDIGEQFFVIS